MGKLAVVGASGFVGRTVFEAASSAGHPIKPVRVRIQDPQGLAAASHPEDWHTHFSGTYEALLHAFRDVDAVVNAAGIADAQAPVSASLHAVNVVLPILIARAACEAGVARFLHVSSAAVQGRRDPLDEQAIWQPFSPYSQSKVGAERILLEREWAPAVQEPAPAIVLYRATSIHGPDRPLTRSLASVALRPFVPVCHRGAVPLPVALWRNLGAGIMHAATTPGLSGIALQPDEGVTAAQLWRAFNSNIRLLNIPTALAQAGPAAIRNLGRRQAKAEALARRFELLLLGQSLQAEKLARSGFRLADPIQQWRELGHTMTPMR